MDNHLMIFESADFGRVRSVLKDGAPWFVAVDVCKALGLNQVTRAMSRLDSDEGGLLEVPHPQNADKTIEINAVSEAGLYHLILCSKKPEARAFKRWITHEVIPSIRKHGAYMTDALLSRMDEHPELISEYIGKLRAENAKANAAREALKKAEAENARLAPKASYYDSFVGVESVTCLRYTAKELGVPQKKFIGYLLEKGYVFRDRHRSDRVFVRAGKRNDPLFVTRDFYLPNGTKSEYTLVTPAGKAHFLKIAEKIRVWEPREVAEGKDASEQAVFAACV
ncbi:MAG: BRO family protein [Christensenellales bacterium]